MTNLSNFKPIKTKHSIIGHTLGMGTASVNPDLGVIVMLVLGSNRVAFYTGIAHRILVGITLGFGGNHAGFSINRLGFSQDGFSFDRNSVRFWWH